MTRCGRLWAGLGSGFLFATWLGGCVAPEPAATEQQKPEVVTNAPAPRGGDESLPRGIDVIRLDGSIALLAPRQRAMVSHLVAAASEMNAIFWQQSYGLRGSFLSSVDDPFLRRWAEINYGPWDRFRGNLPFIDGHGPRPRGGRLYPADMTPQEFLSMNLPEMRQPLSVVERGSNGGLTSVPFREAYREHLERAARQLGMAADLCDDPYFKRYLTLRARALITDDYGPSDLAWARLRGNMVDLVIGPVDHGEDDLFGLKSFYSGWVLLADHPWTQRLSRFAEQLPAIRRSLAFARNESEDELDQTEVAGVYDAISVAGAANAGPKASVVQISLKDRAGRPVATKRLYLRNVMRARFERTTLAVGREMIVPNQRRWISFDAFLDNVTAADLARGLNTGGSSTDQASARSVLRERFELVDGSRSDALGIYVLGWLHDLGEPSLPELDGHLVTYVTALLEDIYRGGADPRASEAVLQFNYLKAYGAVTREQTTGRYRIHVKAAREALGALATQLMIIEGNRDYEAAGRFLENMGGVDTVLKNDLQRLSETEFPLGLVFEQGPEVLGLK